MRLWNHKSYFLALPTVSVNLETACFKGAFIHPLALMRLTMTGTLTMVMVARRGSRNLWSTYAMASVDAPFLAPEESTLK